MDPEITPSAIQTPSQDVSIPEPVPENTSAPIVAVSKSENKQITIDYSPAGIKKGLKHGLKVAFWVAFSGAITALVSQLSGYTVTHSDVLTASWIAVVNAILAGILRWTQIKSGE